MQGTGLDDCAEEYEELKTALTKWGVINKTLILHLIFPSSAKRAFPITYQKFCIDVRIVFSFAK
jgi:mRNA-degrading endonuclease HigB of HigAB toxin-antitoxin module